MQRHFRYAFVLTVCMLPLQSATLERLSLDEMTAKSTAIVRGTVASSRTAVQGPLIFTHYTIQVAERLKGTPATVIDVVVPGGTINGVQQSFAGTPQLHSGDDFVFFLWTGKSGLTQIIGLTQGLFAISGATATRAASREVMLDPDTGLQVKDQTLVLNLTDLRSRIAATLRGSAKQ